jgi:hypothetical protein
MGKDDNVCATCGARADVVVFEGGVVYSYSCTAEVVVLKPSGVRRTVKVCPDIDKVEGPT